MLTDSQAPDAALAPREGDIANGRSVGAQHTTWLLVVMMTAFVALGVLDGGGGVLWTDVINSFGVTKGIFGLASGLGLAIAFPILILGGRLADLFDKRSLLAVSFVLIAIASLGITAAHGAVALTLLLLLRGFGVSLLDLANNALAMDFERESGRHIMGPLHAGFSGGGLLGALVVAAVFKAGGGYVEVYIGIAALFAFLAGIALWTRRQHAPRSRGHAADVSPGRALKLLGDQMLRNLAIITGLCFFGEVLVIQWASIYLRDDRNLSASIAVIALSFYGATMFAGRLGNGPFTARFGPRRALLAQGMTTLLGGVLLAAGGPPIIAIFGCGLAGLGLAGMVPTALSVAGALNPRATGAATGAVLMVGYVGLVAAPFMAGIVATTLSTRAVMAGEAIIGLLVLMVALRLPGLVDQGHVEPRSTGSTAT